MNQLLNALMTKLTWQENELTNHLQAAENESLLLITQMQEIEEQLNKSCVAPQRINPEFEINRLNFITQQHEQNDSLVLDLKNKQILEIKLKDKLLRVKTEIKMLQRYLKRELITQRKLQNKVQEQALDEWVIQKRNHL